MSKPETVPRHEEYVAATERAFSRCPTFKGLRLLYADARYGFLTLRFEGPIDDHRGPYGAVVRLPNTSREEVTGYEQATGSSAEDWTHGNLTARTLAAYASSQNQERPYSKDGVWWLINDEAVMSSPGQRGGPTDPALVNQQ